MWLPKFEGVETWVHFQHTHSRTVKFCTGSCFSHFAQWFCAEESELHFHNLTVSIKPSVSEWQSEADNFCTVTAPQGPESFRPGWSKNMHLQRFCCISERLQCSFLKNFSEASLSTAWGSISTAVQFFSCMHCRCNLQFCHRCRVI